MLSRFITAAWSAITTERNITSSSSAESTTTSAMNSGSLPESTLEKSIEPAVKPPTSTVTPGAALDRRQHVVAQAVDEVGRRRVLRRRARVDLGHRDVPRRRDPRLADRGDVGVCSQRPQRRAARRSAAAPLGSSATSSSGPLKPAPKPCASRSNACRVLVFAGSLPASLVSRRSAKTGVSSTTITASEAIASGHGRACTISLHSRQRERPLRVRGLRRGEARARPARGAAAAEAPRRRGARTSRWPKRESIAGSSVSDATSVSSTASTEAIESP